ncbi:hypothetical protein HKD37_20G056116 [Glycine soja]
MTTPPNSPPPPPTDATSHSPTLKQTRKATLLRSLATRPVRAKRPLVHVDPVTEKTDGPHRKKLRTYLRIVARDNVDVTYENWKQVLVARKDLIWEDIQDEFDIPEASNMRTKKKILQTVGERWRQFKSDLTSNWALAVDKDNVDDTVCKKYDISKENWTQFCQSRRDPSMCERRHRPSRNKTLPFTVDGGEEKEKSWRKLLNLELLTLSLILHLPSDNTCVRAVGAGVTIKQYFGPAPRTSCTSSSMTPEDLEQLTQKIMDQLEESITEKIQSQGLALPPESEVGPSTARVSIKESCVDSSGNNLDMGDSEKCGLYVEENSPRLVALGRLYEGSTTIHNIPLHHDQVKVGVKEVRDADAPIPVPTEEVQLVGQTLNTFVAWLTHLGAMGLAKPPDRPDHDVMWDVIVFGVFNENFPLYIKHEDLSEIAHGGQCLSNSVTQLWILSGQSQFESESYIKNWMQKSKRDVYLGAYLNGSDNYLKGIINKSVLFFNTFALALVGNINILIVQYASMFVLNNSLKGLDDTPQSKSKAAARWIVVKWNRQKGSTEYVMQSYPQGHWIEDSKKIGPKMQEKALGVPNKLRTPYPTS